MSGPVTTVDRLSCTYLAAGDGGAPASIGSRLDAVARDRLAERLGSALDGLLDPADPSVWVIRQLDVDVALTVGGGDDALARGWARALAARVNAVTSGEASLPPGDIAWFPDRAAYLAAFAAEAAAGTADTWEYAAFAGIRALPPGRALATAAAVHGVPLAAVLYRLATRGWAKSFVTGLLEADAAHLWDACVAEAGLVGGHVPADAAALLTDGWQGHASRPRAIRALLATIAALSALPTVEQAPAVVALAGALERGSARGVSAPTTARAPSSSRPEPAGLDDVPESSEPGADRRRAAPIIVDSQREAPRPPTAPQRQTDGIATPFAGLLRLIPVLADLGWEEWRPEARLAVLARCVGAADERRARADEALAIVAGAADDTARSARGPAVVDVLGRLASSGRVTGRAVVESTLPHPTGRGAVLVLRDADSGLWLHAARAAGPRGRARALDQIARSGLVVRSIVAGDDLDLDDVAFIGTARPASHSAVAQAVVRLFGRRLMALGASPIRFLVDNVLRSPGVLRVGPDRVEVSVQPCALQVLLDLGGLGAIECELPWLDAPLRIRAEGRP